ncbi:MAG: hypothetical protein Q7R74_00930 [bacterium]|nr:hypothetical protein [bacterium]
MKVKIDVVDHHAYIISGSAEKGSEEVIATLAERGVPTKGNQDVLRVSFPELSVDDARAIASFASLKSVGEAKYIIVSFGRATGEAQNALLKVVEEAPGNSIFFFCVDSAGHLLPTLRSRCVVVSVSGHIQETEEEGEAKEFLKEGYAERLKRVEKIVQRITRTQERAPVRAFVRGLISTAHQRSADAKTLRDLLDADRFLRLQGSSAKSVLGHLAVSLPRFK